MPSMSRRTFFALSAALVIGACSSEDDSEATTEPTNPPADTTTTEAAVPSTEPATSTSATVAPTTLLDLPADPFTLGVASGDPLPDSVILWTRLIGTLPDEVSVLVEVASDDSFTDVLLSMPATATAEHAHSLHVDATELQPDTWYHYRFSAGGYTSPVGRARTMPADDDTPERFVIGSASCQEYQANYYAAHSDIAAAELDCLFWLGDYIYEGAAEVVEVGGNVRSHATPEPMTLDEYRARYALYKSDAQLQAAHASCPWVVTWDDHEVENNYAGDTSEDGLDAVPAETFRARRAIAYQAWWEHQPVRLDPPEGPDYRIYRASRIGKLADFSVLDGRQYRSDQACGDVTFSLDPPCAETTATDRTMLGSEQESWLFERLGQQETVWNVLAQQTIMANTTVNDAVLNYDQWDGYQAARERMLGYVADAGIDNFVVLTGDIHFAGVALLRVPGALTSPVVGVEFVDTSISSAGNVPQELESLVDSISDVVAVELGHRGWTKHVITPSDWTAEYRIADNAAVENSPSRTWRTFRVEAGVADVEDITASAPPTTDPPTTDPPTTDPPTTAAA